jgi:hypothetical protein
MNQASGVYEAAKEKVQDAREAVEEKSSELYDSTPDRLSY